MMNEIKEKGQKERNEELKIEGIKVMEMQRVIEGKWEKMRIEEMGEEVWKIENIKGGEDKREWQVKN